MVLGVFEQDAHVRTPIMDEAHLKVICCFYTLLTWGAICGYCLKDPEITGT